MKLHEAQSSATLPSSLQGVEFIPKISLLPVLSQINTIASFVLNPVLVISMILWQQFTYSALTNQHAIPLFSLLTVKKVE